MSRGNKGISSFSVVLLMAVAAIIGAACFSMLKVQYTPSAAGNEITVKFSYPEASARIVESEVTSKLEGVFSTITSCSKVSSVSGDGSGSISVVFTKGTDMQAARFEIASQIRNIYSSLPEGCSYPSISINASGEKSQAGIAFSIRSPLPSKDIAKYVEDHMLYPLSTIEGVGSVSFSGDTQYELVITFDADRAAASGISADDIKQAYAEYYAESSPGIVRVGTEMFSVKLRNRCSDDPADIPVKKVGDRVVHLGDIATFRYQEAVPESYSRINGLNTLFLMVDVSSDANLIEVVGKVKEKVAEIQETMPEEIGISVSYDYSRSISEELDKIYVRTILCLAILLIFVFAVNRSWRYMLTIAITLAVNLLISVALYYLSGLHIHIYSLAGITVSLGIIIDNSIVMIDHYSRYHTRSVFPALLSAVFTTVAALLTIFLLPENERANLTDFSIVIAINLLVSLLVSYLFVPALLTYLPVNPQAEGTRLSRRLRRTVRWNRRYSSYIEWGVRHRWVLIAVFIVAFGIPTFLIPAEGGGKKAEQGIMGKAVSAVARWKPYANNKKTVDNILGSSFGLFNKASSRFDFYREPQRTTLTIRAEMPEGCSIQQLNEVMKSMENYLAGVEEIDVFETRISSYNQGSITVLFKPEYENSPVLSLIKGDVTMMASDFGGATWTVSGIDNSFFNNNVMSSFKPYTITLSGYNYDKLTEYGEILVEYLSSIKMVSGAEIGSTDWTEKPMTEFNMQYDFGALSAYGISPYEYYSALVSPLYDTRLDKNIRLTSSSRDEVDMWHVKYTGREVGDSKMKLSGIGDISKDKTGFQIRKVNQSYSITVRFDYNGPYGLSKTLCPKAAKHMNDNVLPIGYVARADSGGWFYSNQDKYAGLLLLVIACIFVILSVHFNSLKYPLSIIFLIPISFIGMFLAFGLSEFTFDKGGFAAFIMLSGITVNAGIYLISEWRQDCGKHPAKDGPMAVKGYIRAFNRKIWPITLTILSTILGLVPFLFDGPKEVFWFCFAIGTIAGLVFSVIALILYLPVFALPRGPRQGSRRRK